jgi:hypothetical protein
MKMWGNATTPQQLRNSINRLRALTEVPEQPKENVLVFEVNPNHHLDISRENEIASNLAFLSATSDDYLKVMAVCVEEHVNGEGMIIRIASNTGDLSAVTSNFILLAKILEQAARRGR